MDGPTLVRDYPSRTTDLDVLGLVLELARDRIKLDVAGQEHAQASSKRAKKAWSRVKSPSPPPSPRRRDRTPSPPPSRPSPRPAPRPSPRLSPRPSPRRRPRRRTPPSSPSSSSSSSSSTSPASSPTAPTLRPSPRRSAPSSDTFWDDQKRRSRQIAARVAAENAPVAKAVADIFSAGRFPKNSLVRLTMELKGKRVKTSIAVNPAMSLATRLRMAEWNTSREAQHARKQRFLDAAYERRLARQRLMQDAMRKAQQPKLVDTSIVVNNKTGRPQLSIHVRGYRSKPPVTLRLQVLPTGRVVTRAVVNNLPKHHVKLAIHVSESGRPEVAIHVFRLDPAHLEPPDEARLPGVELVESEPAPPDAKPTEYVTLRPRLPAAYLDQLAALQTQVQQLQAALDPEGGRLRPAAARVQRMQFWKKHLDRLGYKAHATADGHMFWDESSSAGSSVEQSLGEDSIDEDDDKDDDPRLAHLDTLEAVRAAGQRLLRGQFLRGFRRAGADREEAEAQKLTSRLGFAPLQLPQRHERVPRRFPNVDSDLSSDSDVRAQTASRFFTDRMRGRGRGLGITAVDVDVLAGDSEEEDDIGPPTPLPPAAHPPAVLTSGEWGALTMDDLESSGDDQPVVLDATTRAQLEQYDRFGRIPLANKYQRPAYGLGMFNDVGSSGDDDSEPLI